ncbi:MAG: cation-translocating P-type ATPase, partial [Methylotetracoccus sp.]|nr:cation-translocating P-type ATPase [Methylotetracoccus sp.]
MTTVQAAYPAIEIPAAPISPGIIRVTVIRSPVSGRARVRVRGLYRCETLRLALEELPRCCPDLRSVEANPLTGNALILFDPQQSLAEIMVVLEHCARAYGPDLPDPIATPETRSVAPRRATPRHHARVPGDKDPAKEPWHARSPEEILGRWSSQAGGLSTAVAADRLSRHGQNVLTDAPRRSPIAMFLEQFASPPVALLGLSAVVSVATGGIADAVVILGVVVINAVIGYVTEAQAEKTIHALSHIGPTHAAVIRDGRKISISIAEVVPGDILDLSPGSYIAADARLLSSNQLSVDESALTGESLPVVKSHGFAGTAETPLGDRRNMLHRGTVVTGGSGRAVVVATGKHTEIGFIQSLVGEVRTPETPLQRQLDAMGMQLAMLSGGICLVVFGIGVWRGVVWLEMLKSAISLAVAAVPEGLPTVATSTLALGIREMQRRHVLIRQLPAVESLGSVQTLCFDKTGTLTENRMRVVSIQTPGCAVVLSANGDFFARGRSIRPTEMPALARLIDVAALCSEVKLNGDSDRTELEGSPTETALVDIAIRAGRDVHNLRGRYPLLKTVHRAEGRPYMATVHDRGDGEYRIAVKGSPAEVLAMCEYRLEGRERVCLDDEWRTAVLEQNQQMAGQALRVLGLADGSSSDMSTEAVTRRLTWLGLVGMEDGIRPGMAALISQFHEAGIDTVMITGDQSATAFSVGQRLGLNYDKALEIVDSTHLDKLDPQLLRGIVRDTTVFARVSPAHKLRIVQALQEAGRVVAMTGDGINDGPALKAADVGVAMGAKGTEVARSVADVVLEEDDLHTMIIAVQQGRTIYRNIRKSLQYLLSSNLSEIEIMLIGTAIGAGEVLNPIQLLWINLITDILPALGLALEPPESDVLRERPRDPAEAILRRSDLLRLVRQS